ncbi:DUF2325 domain-containing protein [Undibacterium flavidum]|uniref:DUF2325 domain-containing protein n=1 Tax=Undibacterium flavidum TaxID=2762297 RepID=A0ABR6YH71_9BURK|nr:DUF2325 domain-containing protein [Undibacterium flavidum]MBC3875911.1 DUF2325 domain-containing protein [Undibacterium flavidum]
MCEKHESSQQKQHNSATATKPLSSRRRRLWDLSRETHCPVIGVCIPLAVLRRLLGKAVGGATQADDYEIHVGAIAESSYRNRLSELLQEDLEQRYSLTIKRFRTAKTVGALTQLWLDAIYQGDVAGAFWAGLTHPLCDLGLQEGMCRDMHMLQHQAGATVRADIVRFNAVLEENALLAREIARHQERHTRHMQEKAQEIEKLQRNIVQLRAECIGKESIIAYLNTDLQALKNAAPERVQAEKNSHQQLQQKLERMGVRQAELEQKIRELKHKLTYKLKQTNKHGSLEVTNENVLENTLESALENVTSAKEFNHHRTIPITLQLQQKNVLCVGGRSGNVASYRDLIERVGGRFAHHDGGMEDSQNLLDSSLAAADLVICQTGCISHNAYWRVKEFCKRTGKRCVFVENPSVSSLARGLEQVSEEATTTVDK